MRRAVSGANGPDHPATAQDRGHRGHRGRGLVSTCTYIETSGPCASPVSSETGGHAGHGTGDSDALEGAEVDSQHAALAVPDAHLHLRPAVGAGYGEVTYPRSWSTQAASPRVCDEHSADTNILDTRP